MQIIAELTSRVIAARDKKRRKGKEHSLLACLPDSARTGRAYTYETEVFNYLFNNKDALGIKDVIRYENLIVDGLVVLAGGIRLVIEVKLRMGWLKACQAEWQFRQVLKRHAERVGRVDGGIVFFEDSSPDFNRIPGGGKNVWGWEAWYLFYREAIEGKPLDLLRLRKGKLEGYPS